MIFKKYRDIKQYIDAVCVYDQSLLSLQRKIEEDLNNGFKFVVFQFIQKKDYHIDIYGKVKPILGEMYDQNEEYFDSKGFLVSTHTVTFLAKKLPDGTLITPENIVFKVDITPKTRQEYQKLTVVEIIEVNSISEVQGFNNV